MYSLNSLNGIQLQYRLLHFPRNICFFCYEGCACKLVYSRRENLVIISCKSISVQSAALRVHSYHELSGINQNFQMLAQIFDLCATAVAVAVAQ